MTCPAAAFYRGPPAVLVCPRVLSPSQAERMTIRRLIFWTHLLAAAGAGLVILTMSVTGVLLTYERQLIAWSDRQYRSAPPADGAARLPIEALIAGVTARHPEVRPTAITVGATSEAPVVLTAGPRPLYLDAYSGATLGEGSTTVRAVMSELRAWHRWLAVDGAGRPTARAITGWSTLIFLFIVVSGLYLWLPRKWTWPRVRPVVLFTPGARGKARDFNWHNVIGLWSAVPLFLVVLTALPISFPWANALVYRAAGETPPAAGGPRGAGPGAAAPGRGDAPRESPAPLRVDGLDALLSSAARHVEGWRTITVRIPASPQAPVVFAIDRGDGGQPHLRSTLTLDRTTGAVVSDEAFGDQTLGRRLRSISRFAHTGEVLGVPGQTIAGLASAGAVVLVWTGLALMFRRFRGWLTRRSTHARGESVRQRTAA
jgi:uncharacterized iron-regulated membrane protein